MIYLNVFLLIIVCVLFLLKMNQKPTLSQHFDFLDEGLAYIDENYELISFNSKFFKILRAEIPSARIVLNELNSFHEGMIKECVALIDKAKKQTEPAQETFFFKKDEVSFAIGMKATRICSAQVLLILQDKDQEKREFSLGKEFIANASHELRTPITIIKGFIETLRDLPEVSDAMLEDIFEKILRNCARMEEMVKNLLILTDLDHLFAIQRKEIDLLSLIDNLKHNLLQLYPHVAIEVRSSEKELSAKIDLSLIELAIMNVLQNAVKYSKEDPKIILELLKQEGEIIVSVIDSGIGIPKEKLPYIFERFYSVDKARCRKLGGAGLGLSIVKKIVEKHEGTISVENNPQGGTIFRLHFPQSLGKDKTICV